jgi:hypothetical protein
VVFVRLCIRFFIICAALGACIGPANAQTLRGVVDLHAHSGPDVVPRSIDSLSLARLTRKAGFRGIVLKNHYEPTAALAALAAKEVRGLDVLGGIVLNRAVGGVNPAAVERMTRIEGGRGRVVWMPTFDSENQVRVSKEPRPFVAVSSNGRLLPEVIEVLDLVAKHDLVLATGHSSPAEVLMLVREAGGRGVKRILVTHGMLGPVSMTDEQMREAADAGASIEFVGNAVLGTLKEFEFSDYARAMRTVGVSRCILSSDFGQKGNPLHPEGLEQVFAGLRQAGVSPSDIETMAKTNPARLLGLP